MVNVCVTSTVVSGGSGIQYVFTNWSGDASGTSTCVNVTMNGAKTVTAQSWYQYWVEITAGTGGSASPASGWYDPGEVIEISASASPGYHFVRVVARMTHISCVEGFLPHQDHSRRKETFSPSTAGLRAPAFYCCWLLGGGESGKANNFNPRRCVLRVSS